MIKPRYHHPHQPMKVYDPAQVFADHVEQFHARNDTWALGCCPFHNDRNPSLSMNLETGWFRCNSTHCRAEGNSIVTFIVMLFDFCRREALDYLEKHYG